MKEMQLRAWLLVPFTVAGAFLLSGVTAALGSNLLGLWELPVEGFCAAFGVVVSSYLAVPRFKLGFATLALALGALAAWWLLKDSYWPENYPGLAYQPTSLPLRCTYTGGIIGLVIAFVLSWRRANSLKKSTGRVVARSSARGAGN
jgi:hypothetical protein